MFIGLHMMVGFCHRVSTLLQPRLSEVIMKRVTVTKEINEIWVAPSFRIWVEQEVGFVELRNGVRGRNMVAGTVSGPGVLGLERQSNSLASPCRRENTSQKKGPKATTEAPCASHSDETLQRREHSRSYRISDRKHAFSKINKKRSNRLLT
jgi:hypothetical protein